MGRAAQIRGRIGRVAWRYLFGWIYDKDSPETPIVINVHVDGIKVANQFADEYREDLKKAGIGDGCHAFTVAIPDAFFDDAAHTITVEAAASRVFLPALENVVLNSREVRFVVKGLSSPPQAENRPWIAELTREQLRRSFVVSFTGSPNKYLYLLPDQQVFYISGSATISALKGHCFFRQLPSHKFGFFHAQNCGEVTLADESAEFPITSPGQTADEVQDIRVGDADEVQDIRVGDNA